MKKEEAEKETEEEKAEREEQERKERNLKKIQAQGGAMGLGGLFGGANPMALRGNLKSTKSCTNLVEKKDDAPKKNSFPGNPMAGFNPAALKSGLRSRGATVASRAETTHASVTDGNMFNKEEKKEEEEKPKIQFQLRKTGSSSTLTGDATRSRSSTVATPAVNNELAAMLARRKQKNGE